MQVGDPEEEIVKVAQAGIRGMVGALGRDTIAPAVMIDAALHVLAAWVASSQAHSPAGERDAEVDELLEILPSYTSTTEPPGGFPNRTETTIRETRDAARRQANQRRVWRPAERSTPEPALWP